MALPVRCVKFCQILLKSFLSQAMKPTLYRDNQFYFIVNSNDELAMRKILLLHLFKIPYVQNSVIRPTETLISSKMVPEVSSSL